MNILRQYVRQMLVEQAELPEEPILPKNEWVALSSGDERREKIQQELFDLVQMTYANIGGHFKVGKPEDLERYMFWVVKDIDGDPEPDVAIFGKPDIGGVKRIGIDQSDQDYPTFHDKDGFAKQRYGENIAYLFRPDGHIIATFKNPNREDVLAVLNHVKGK